MRIAESKSVRDIVQPHVDKLRANIQTISESVSSIQMDTLYELYRLEAVIEQRDMTIRTQARVIAELRSQLRDAQDNPDIDDTQLIGASYHPVPSTSWFNKQPEGDNGAYARGMR